MAGTCVAEKLTVLSICERFPWTIGRHSGLWMLSACERFRLVIGRHSGQCRLFGDDRGDVAVEYIVLIGTIAIPAIAAFMAAGKTIVQNYTVLQNVLLMPLP